MALPPLEFLVPVDVLGSLGGTILVKGTQRYEPVPSASVLYRPSNRTPRLSCVKLSPTMSSPSTIQRKS